MYDDSRLWTKRSPSQIGLLLGDWGDFWRSLVVNRGAPGWGEWLRLRREGFVEARGVLGALVGYHADGVASIPDVVNWERAAWWRSGLEILAEHLPEAVPQDAVARLDALFVEQADRTPVLEGVPDVPLSHWWWRLHRRQGPLRAPGEEGEPDWEIGALTACGQAVAEGTVVAALQNEWGTEAELSMASPGRWVTSRSLGGTVSPGDVVGWWLAEGVG